MDCQLFLWFLLALLWLALLSHQLALPLLVLGLGPLLPALLHPVVQLAYPLQNLLR